MKKFIRFFSIVLCLVLMASVFAACKPANKDDIEIED